MWPVILSGHIRGRFPVGEFDADFLFPDCVYKKIEARLTSMPFDIKGLLIKYYCNANMEASQQMEEEENDSGVCLSDDEALEMEREDEIDEVRAYCGQSPRELVACKQPVFQSLSQSGAFDGDEDDDEELEVDLPTYFKKRNIPKVQRIRICRTYASSLAATMRPTKYKKSAPASIPIPMDGCFAKTPSSAKCGVKRERIEKEN